MSLTEKYTRARRLCRTKRKIHYMRVDGVWLGFKMFGWPQFVRRVSDQYIATSTFILGEEVDWQNLIWDISSRLPRRLQRG